MIDRYSSVQFTQRSNEKRSKSVAENVDGHREGSQVRTVLVEVFHHLRNTRSKHGRTKGRQQGQRCYQN